MDEKEDRLKLAQGKSPKKCKNKSDCPFRRQSWHNKRNEAKSFEVTIFLLNFAAKQKIK
uniref:hypothetical protein n=1 Tax=Segatella hominis TaxID=2518605 RepID=UPI0040254125